MKLRFIDPRMFKHIDWLLFANIMVLILFSLVAIASAVSEPLAEGTGSLSAVLSQLDLDYVIQQLTWLAVGLFAMFVVLLPDYHAIGEYYKWIYTILIILLVAVLLFGKTVNGTKGWFRIGNSGFQPSEIGKVAIIILLARMISDRTKNKDGGITTVKELLPILGVFLLPLALIIAQPDFGTAMVYVFTFFSMLFLARTSLKLAFAMVGCVCVGGCRQRARCCRMAEKTAAISFLASNGEQGTPHTAVSGQRAPGHQSKIAIGSGQLGGKGLFSMGGESRLWHIAGKHTGFIFASTTRRWALSAL